MYWFLAYFFTERNEKKEVVVMLFSLSGERGDIDVSAVILIVSAVAFPSIFFARAYDEQHFRQKFVKQLAAHPNAVVLCKDRAIQRWKYFPEKDVIVDQDTQKAWSVLACTVLAEDENGTEAGHQKKKKAG